MFSTRADLSEEEVGHRIGNRSLVPAAGHNGPLRRLRRSSSASASSLAVVIFEAGQQREHRGVQSTGPADAEAAEGGGQGGGGRFGNEGRMNARKLSGRPISYLS